MPGEFVPVRTCPGNVGGVYDRGIRWEIIHEYIKIESEVPLPESLKNLPSSGVLFGDAAMLEVEFLD
jgi:hypothetical protein